MKTQDPLDRILEQFDEMRALRRPDDLLDTARRVEDAMEALGWDVRSARQVSRELRDLHGPVVLRFWLEERVRLSVAVFAYRSGLGHVALEFLGAREEDWRTVTNGELWKILRPDGAEEHTIDIRTRSASVMLRRLLSQASHSSGVIDFIGPGGMRLQAKSRIKNSEAGPEVWPDRATHALHRRGYYAFIEYDPEQKKVTLLPGSVLRAKVGSSLPEYHRRIRERAIATRQLVPAGDTLRLVSDLPADSPSAAATIAAGSVASGWSHWRDRDGNPIRRAAADGSGEAG